MGHRRIKDPVILNFYLNHSKIRKCIAPDGTGYVDATELLERPGAELFIYGDGIVFFWPEEDGHYLEAHFLKRRGKDAKEAIETAIEIMFRTGVKKIVAEVPEFNRQSRYMVRSLGFERAGIKGTWVKDGVPYSVIQYWRANDERCISTNG